ncbi:MAG: ABC transporter permease [Elusimicrobiota bacterium]|jgi:ABC-2 type transport system permease protein
MNKDLAVYINQLREMTRCEWRLREQSTVLGFIWTLLNPLLTYLVLYKLFTRWMGGYMADYPAYLLIGVVQYGFFTTATTYGMSSLNRRRGILMNFPMSRDILVFTAVLSISISYGIELLLMLGFLLAVGAPVSLSWLAFPVVVMLQALFVTGLALLLSVVAVRFFDFERIWSIVTTAGFFLTPIFYTTAAIAQERQDLLRFNPMAHVIELSRDCLLRGQFPEWWRLAGLAAFAFCAAGAGYALFKNQEERLSDYVLP